MANPSLKALLAGGSQYSELSRKQAEALVKRLVKSGEVRRKDSKQLVLTVVARSRETTDRLAALVQAEVAKQIAELRHRFDDVEARVESLTPNFVATKPAPASTAKKTPAKKTAPKKSAAKKAPAKSAAKNSPAKKSAPKKSAAKKAHAKQAAVGSSGVRKVSSRKPS